MYFNLKNNKDYFVTATDLSRSPSCSLTATPIFLLFPERCTNFTGLTL